MVENGESIFENSTKLNEKKSYKILSWALVLLLFSIILLPSLVHIVVIMVLPQFSKHYMLGIPLNYFCMYAIAFPLMLLILKKIPDRLISKKQTASSLKLIQLLGLVLMGLGIMTVGSMLGTLIESFIINKSATLTTDQLANLDIPQWIFFISGVLIAPIMEEIIFRWIPYKKVAIYGEKTYVIWTSIFFGLVHMNFGQSLYAGFLGILLAVVTYRTGTIKYSIFIHIMINFLAGIGIGSIILRTGNEKLYMIYSSILLVLAAIGVVLFIVCLFKHKGKIYTNNAKKVNWTNFFSAGSIVYLLVALAVIFMSFFI